MFVIMVQKTDGGIPVQARDEEHCRALLTDLVNAHGEGAVSVEVENGVRVPALQWLEAHRPEGDPPAGAAPKRRRKKAE